MALLLGRNDILAAEDIKTETVDCPEWGGEVIVRGLTGTQRDEWEASNTEQHGNQIIPNLQNWRARLVVRTIVDEQNRPVFTPTDAEQLGEKNAAVLNRIFDVAARLSGITPREQEEMAKNSGAPPGSDSSSSSPGTSASQNGNS